MCYPFKPLLLPYADYIDPRDFFNEAVNAANKIGEFNTKIKQVNVDSSYIFAHLLNLESLYSTKIEGTQTTIDKVYEEKLNYNESTKSNDIKEVERYHHALVSASQWGKEDPITDKTIKNIHKTLLEGNIRKNCNFIAGEFRTQQNKVGEHIPPIAAEVDGLMGNLVRYMNDDRGMDDAFPHIVKAAIIHAQFETIHPFPDGNGRVGRVLIPIYLFKQQAISTPFFFLSQTLEQNKIKYYTYLQGTRQKTKEGFSNWIKFFLNSVVCQVNKDITLIDQLEKLYASTLEKAKSLINSSKHDFIIHAIFQNPIFTIQSLYNETLLNKSTLRKYVKVLLEQEIIYKDQQTRNAKYYLLDLLDILNN